MASAAAIESHNGTRTVVVTPTRTAPACRTSQLTLNYDGGGPAVGNDFGTIIIRDTSAKACLLLGPITVVGSDTANHLVTRSLRYPVARGLVLSPEAGRIALGASPPTGEIVAAVTLGAEYRDGPYPPADLCTRHQVIPAEWHITLPDGSALVPNASRDPHYPAFSSLITCQGELNTPSPVSPLPQQ
jgi:hypothetical protein